MEKKILPAAFSLINFKFIEFHFDYESAPSDQKLDINFNPSGIFHNNNKNYDLKIEFLASDESKQKVNAFIKVSILAEFDFKNVSSIEEIPSYFYKNSIAIVYPYIRAFVSNLSLQANYGPFILPTLNLSMLEDTLMKNTTAV